MAAKPKIQLPSVLQYVSQRMVESYNEDPYPLSITFRGPQFRLNSMILCTCVRWKICTSSLLLNFILNFAFRRSKFLRTFLRRVTIRRSTSTALYFRPTVDPNNVSSPSCRLDCASDNHCQMPMRVICNSARQYPRFVRETDDHDNRP